MRRLRTRFWLAAMDVFGWLEHRAHKAWTYALTRASDATDWGYPVDAEDVPESERPF